jgi:hypothetical protein
VGKGGEDVGKGTAKGAGSLDKGTAGAAGNLATLHPGKAGADLGKGLPYPFGGSFADLACSFSGADADVLAGSRSLPGGTSPSSYCLCGRFTRTAR